MSRGLLGAVLVLALLLALVLSNLVAAGKVPPLSVRSKEPQGRLAAALLLEELGLVARRLEAPPLALPAARAVLWMPGVPDLPEHLLRGPDEARGPALDDPRHALHYRHFVEQGGTLVLPAGERERTFLERVFELADPPLGEELWDSPDRARLLAGPPLAIDFAERLTQDGRELRIPLRASGPEALAVDGAGRVVVLRYVHGAGSIVLLAEGGFFSNEFIGHARHAELFVRLVGELTARGEDLYFDEFALGSWAPAGKLELALAPGVRGLTLHLVLLALVGAWIVAWPREFPRDAPPLERRSPLERARAQAGLLVRSGHWAHLALRLRQGLLRRLAARLRLVRRELERMEEVEAALAELAALPHAPPAATLRELFVTRPVRDAAALESLGRELALLERELLEHDVRSVRLPIAVSRREDGAPAATR